MLVLFSRLSLLNKLEVGLGIRFFLGGDFILGGGVFDGVEMEFFFVLIDGLFFWRFLRFGGRFLV